MLVALAVAFGAVTGGAGHDCRQPSTTAEAAICASPDLALLDTQVATAFGAVQARRDLFNSGVAEQMEQALWLSRRSERCADATTRTACLTDLYRSRLAELEAAARTNPNAPTPFRERPVYPVTLPQDLAVCEAVAAAADRVSRARPKPPPIPDPASRSRGPVSPFLEKAAWRDGAADVGLGTDDEGTSHTSLPLTARKGETRTLEGGWFAPRDEGEDWYMSSRWFFHSGRPYVVRFAGWNDAYPVYVGALMDDLSERPLCLLRTKVDVRLKPMRPADASVCHVLWNDGGQSVATTAVKMRFVGDREIPGSPTVIDRRVSVDAMNDGRQRTMYLYGAASGAGAGCDLHYYDTAPEDKSSPVHKAWNLAQGLDLKDAYPRRTCADAEPTWRRVGRRTYLLSQSTHPRDPGYEQDEFLIASTVEHGAPRQVCQGDFSRRAVTITHVWGNGGWRPVGQ